MDTSHFLSAVYEVIRLNYPSGNPEGMTAARAGFLIRQAFPGLSWESIGFPKLKHILEELQARGLIRIGTNRKHALSVWLASDTESQGVATSAVVSPWPPRHSLRKDVWNAFVLELPLGRRFLNRRTGNVRMATPDAPNASQDWVEIRPIGQETQKAWARDFLQANNLENDEACLAALDAPDWYRHLPGALGANKANLLPSWNRVRTQYVIGHVREWCETESVPESFVFEQRVSREERPQGMVGMASRDIRSAVLRALSRMTVDELLEIRSFGEVFGLGLCVR